MRLQRRVIEEGGAKVPAYIVTYSDMVTLLLTFFVMLLSLSNVQDPELFNKGRDSFLESIRYIGLGIFFGRKEMPHFGHLKIRHYVDNPDETFDLRSIDAKGEESRRNLAKLARYMTITESQVVAQKTNFSVTNIRFGDGGAALDETAKKFLSEFCLQLQQSLGAKPVKLYILGLACDVATERRQWILSASRAQVVADYIRDNLPSVSKPAVYSWGAGPGGYWVGRDSPVYQQSHILIAVLR